MCIKKKKNNGVGGGPGAPTLSWWACFDPPRARAASPCFVTDVPLGGETKDGRAGEAASFGGGGNIGDIVVLGAGWKHWSGVSIVQARGFLEAWRLDQTGKTRRAQGQETTLSPGEGEGETGGARARVCCRRRRLGKRETSPDSTAQRRMTTTTTDPPGSVSLSLLDRPGAKTPAVRARVKRMQGPPVDRLFPDPPFFLSFSCRHRERKKGRRHAG